MQVTFQLTEQDYRDALALHARSRPNYPVSFLERYQILLLIPALFVLLVVVGVLERSIGGNAAPGAGGSTISNALLNGCLPMLPWLILFGIIWAALARRISPRERTAMRWFLLANMILSLLTAGIAQWLNPTPSMPPTPPPTETSNAKALLGLAPMLVLLIGNAAIFLLYVRASYRRAWEGQQHLHQPTEVDASETGLIHRTPVNQNEQQWGYFRAFRESDSLFLLYVGDLAFHLVPKRAFTNPADLEQFRDLLERHIGGASPRPFQPIPLPPPLPGRLTPPNE